MGYCDLISQNELSIVRNARIPTCTSAFRRHIEQIPEWPDRIRMSRIHAFSIAYKKGWDYFWESLKKYLETGTGMPAEVPE